MLLALASCEQQSRLETRASANTTVNGAGGAPSVDSPPSSGAGGEAGAFDPISVDCHFEIHPEISSRIASVGIVRWSSDLPDTMRAYIEFGLDTSYGHKAPVDLSEPDNRTLLLGMKASREYHLRVVAESESERCVSPDQTLLTGPVPNQMPRLTVNTSDAAAVSAGYIVTGQYSGGPAYIIDGDGDFVWWFPIGGEVMNARMSYDGRHMWINSGNVPAGTANVHRVSMDGLDDLDLSAAFEGQHHHLTVLPDETVAFIAYGDNGCDDIKEYSPDTSVRTLINAQDAHGGGDCHVNAIEYSPFDDTLIFSDLEHDNYTKIRRDGEVVWVLGGAFSDFTGSGSTWSNQHGLHVLDRDRLVFFNNGLLGGLGSLAIEVRLNLTDMTATRTWEYAASPALTSHVMGDTQRLDNGNTLVVYSGQGIIQEVDSRNNVVQEVVWDLGGAIGYASKRRTLYGFPPK